MADHHLAGDFAARVMAPTGLGFVEGKHAVDDRPDLVLFHGPIINMVGPAGLEPATRPL